ncbi:hypothetical protein BN1356_02531 [Streptococcus varani]|uniref:Uncharacterized protein n=1 Tax=Streptococcus varani TaxID=1608583 RepID=A0A0E4H6H5_9STRE|nr:hypothetical protein [Streptococcus varani]CQR26172.1 hypothetical protein BN1356_02531 [Streptococcus varani]
MSELNSQKIEISNHEALIGTQLQIGKQVMKVLFELFTDESKKGAVLPIQLNGMNFNITVEKED